MKTLGTNIKKLRESLGLSQFQLSKLVGTTQQRISEWERDLYLPTLPYFDRILKALDVSYEELTDGVNI